MKNLIYTLILITLASCDALFLGNELDNTPENNFNALWDEFDQKYGMFPLKEINWDSVKHEYIERVPQVSSDEELYALLVDMLEILDDSHVALVPTNSNLSMYQGGVYGRLDTINDFHLDVIKDNYLITSNKAGYYLTYGYLNDNIGYIHIEGFSDLAKGFEEPMDEVLGFFNDAEGLIIDARGGYGGEDVAGQYIAGRFADDRRPYMINKIRNGREWTDFTDPVTWYVEPEGDNQFLKPVIVLTHRFTISARETFCLAMKVLPQVTFMGDTTTGAFSNQINRELPNGWGYSVSIGDWRDADGISHEGIGLIPDVLIENRKSDLLNGRDQLLEAAIERLNVQ